MMIEFKLAVALIAVAVLMWFLIKSYVLMQPRVIQLQILQDIRGGKAEKVAIITGVMTIVMYVLIGAAIVSILWGVFKL